MKLLPRPRSIVPSVGVAAANAEVPVNGSWKSAEFLEGMENYRRLRGNTDMATGADSSHDQNGTRASSRDGGASMETVIRLAGAIYGTAYQSACGYHTDLVEDTVAAPAAITDAAATTTTATAAKQKISITTVEARFQSIEKHLKAEILRRERNEEALNALEYSFATLYKAVFHTTWIKALALIRRGKGHNKGKDTGLVKGKDKISDKGKGNGSNKKVPFSGQLVDDGDDNSDRLQIMAILDRFAAAKVDDSTMEALSDGHAHEQRH
jgi:hypothetical protein